MEYKNITLSLKPEIYKFAKILAAKKDKSLSSFVAELLEQLMHQESLVQDAARDYFSPGPYFKRQDWKLNREEIYDRKVFR